MGVDLNFLGDWFLHPSVIADPFVNKLDLTDNDEFLIIACDGVWDVLEDEEAVSFVSFGLDKGSSAQECADMLKDISLRKGSTDNISAIVIDLKRSPVTIPITLT
eukprot:TRINITY_DN1383_c0_g1_i10.p2 TRINITY_DN1383_c0_g1~~TRINITY_DN1383_c0_g1_i10.p2  ORF type:complete len:105 (+),score=13.84 TRINITY_DN1383_c0_g1_i10:694-1008(+)